MIAGGLDPVAHHGWTVTVPASDGGQPLTGRLLSAAQWVGGMRANGGSEGPRTTITVLPPGAGKCTSRTVPASTEIELAS